MTTTDQHLPADPASRRGVADPTRPAPGEHGPHGEPHDRQPHDRQLHDSRAQAGQPPEGRPGTGHRDTDHDHRTPDRRAPWASITACPDGPLLVRGDVEILLASGDPAPRRRSTVALCRCGASGIKPFCDGSHKAVGFRTEDEPRTGPGAGSQPGRTTV